MLRVVTLTPLLVTLKSMDFPPVPPTFLSIVLCLDCKHFSFLLNHGMLPIKLFISTAIQIH